ncbi:hypothetical protein [Archangium sp.]|uniref:hypothetical protein n=1 Tax=Archangium sp. TaxID=1872627 RepID=UPI002D604756|nr:hypothetical protein [Archangium sp.]HYO58875.1 hypothetical protein [Archangium sp.]
MIHYPVTQQELEARIDLESPTWLKRARKRTQAHRKSGRFKGTGIWGEIKRVYMDLQHYKCAYCERALEKNWSANVEYDVEHFRPKGRVIPWPTPEHRKRRGFRYKVRNGAPGGYPLLAHSYRNYLATCAVCNSAHKRDYFPIAGKADSTLEDIPPLNRKEKPLLLHPLGDWGEDPEQFLTFAGCVPVPTKRSGPARRRAQVCIDLFELDTRGRLLTERAHVLVLLWPHLERLRTGSKAEQTKAQGWLAAVTAAHLPHASCARAFVRMYQSDLPKAREHHEAACELVKGKEPKLYEKLFKKAKA